MGKHSSAVGTAGRQHINTQDWLCESPRQFKICSVRRHTANKWATAIPTPTMPENASQWWSQNVNIYFIATIKTTKDHRHIIQNFCTGNVIAHQRQCNGRLINRFVNHCKHTTSRRPHLLVWEKRCRVKIRCPMRECMEWAAGKPIHFVFRVVSELIWEFREDGGARGQSRSCRRKLSGFCPK